MSRIVAKGRVAGQAMRTAAGDGDKIGRYIKRGLSLMKLELDQDNPSNLFIELSSKRPVYHCKVVATYTLFAVPRTHTTSQNTPCRSSKSQRRPTWPTLGQRPPKSPSSSPLPTKQRARARRRQPSPRIPSRHPGHRRGTSGILWKLG